MPRIFLCFVPLISALLVVGYAAEAEETRQFHWLW